MKLFHKPIPNLLAEHPQVILIFDGIAKALDEGSLRKLEVIPLEDARNSHLDPQLFDGYRLSVFDRFADPVMELDIALTQEVDISDIRGHALNAYFIGTSEEKLPLGTNLGNAAVVVDPDYAHTPIGDDFVIALKETPVHVVRSRRKEILQAFGYATQESVSGKYIVPESKITITYPSGEKIAHLKPPSFFERKGYRIDIGNDCTVDVSFEGDFLDTKIMRAGEVNAARDIAHVISTVENVCDRLETSTGTLYEAVTTRYQLRRRILDRIR